MFGYKARHIKSTMVMDSTPDACNQSHMKIEIDGWYANLANFSCGGKSPSAPWRAEAWEASVGAMIASS